MKTAWLRLLFALLAMFVLPSGAHATLTCTSLTASPVSINYVNNTTTSVQAFFAVTCTRTSTSDPTSVTYSVLADNGRNPTGINNKATLNAANTLRYDFYTNSACGTQWKGNTSITDTISWSQGSTGTITKQTGYWACITNAQTAGASGTYTDTVYLTLSYGTSTLPGTVNVSIYAPALCTVTTPAGNITLGYAAFGPQVTGSTTMRVTCTSGMPYTLATDVPEGVLSGVRYVLGLSATSANGTGAAQAYTITATAPSGQAGTCAGASCSASRTHTLTISY